MKASTNCFICGLDSPHAHTEKEVDRERVLRPIFERYAVSRLMQPESPWRKLISPGFGLTYAPCNGVGTYPFVLGWNGLPPAKNFGGQDAFPKVHWAYRASYDSPYANEHVELLWQLFLDSIGVVTQLHKTLKEE